MSGRSEDQLREERFSVLDRIWRDNADVDPDEVKELVARAIAVLRREKAPKRKENLRATEKPQ